MKMNMKPTRLKKLSQKSVERHGKKIKNHASKFHVFVLKLYNDIYIKEKLDEILNKAWTSLLQDMELQWF